MCDLTSGITKARRAAEHDARIVTVGQLFLLDRAAMHGYSMLSTIWPPRLARDGDPEPIHIEDSDTTFAIE
jgi:hypothetical protein